MASLGRDKSSGGGGGVFCLFAKPPRAGHSKTRLARTVGAKAAAVLAEAFLKDTVNGLLAAGSPGRGLIIATPQPEGHYPGVPSWVPRWDHGAGDLGARQERIVRRALYDNPRADWAIAVGADSPGVPQAYLKQAIRSLESGEAEAVIGPALDGGFYLLGLRRCPVGLFANLPWSQDITGASMLTRLEEFGLKTQVMMPWFDVDEGEDLKRLTALIDQGRLAAPWTRQVCKPKPVCDTYTTHISIIVPALNEAARLSAAVGPLVGQPGVEVIVVDGGSDDGTVALARQLGALVVRAPRGRGPQQNAGAAMAAGEILVFLHADAILPPGAVAAVVRALEGTQNIGGSFHLRTVDYAGGFGILGLLRVADIRSRVTKIPYGDQAIFVKAKAFEAAGGFPPWPLMEDIGLSERLMGMGPMVRIRKEVQVSGRRLMARPLKTFAAYHSFPLLHRLGVAPNALARLYSHVR